MEKYNKAIGAGIGGGALGVVTAVALIPAGSPSWLYAAVILGFPLVSAFSAYIAKKNDYSDD